MDSKCLHIQPRLFFQALLVLVFFWGGIPLSSFLSPRLPNQPLLCFGGGGGGFLLQHPPDHNPPHPIARVTRQPKGLVSSSLANSHL